MEQNLGYGIWITNEDGRSHWLPPIDDPQCDVAMIFRTAADAEREAQRQMDLYDLIDYVVLPFDWSKSEC